MNDRARVGAAEERAPSGIVFESPGMYKSTLFMIVIRNTGGGAVNVCGLSLVAGEDRWMSDGGIELICGSCELGGGESGLVVTHPSVPTDDEQRGAYKNVYRAVRADGEGAVIGKDGIRLVGRDGEVVARGDSLDPEPIGICCRPASINEPCAQVPPDPCDGTDPMCATQVYQNYCCNDLNGCCFEESDAQTCQARGCAGVNPTYTCP